jgi:hypothetical protein
MRSSALTGVSWVRRSLFDCCAVAIVLCLLAAVPAPAKTPAIPDFAGTLCALVFDLPVEPHPVDPATLPGDLKTRVEKYQQRAVAFRSHLRGKKQTVFIPEVLQAKRLQMERSIVALIDAPGIKKLAADCASHAVLFYEWEGDSGPPLDEAAWAEEYATKKSHEPLLPYLHLFLAHRYRCAFEAATREGNQDARNRAGAGYTRALALAMEDADPLVRAIARDMNRQQYLYLDTGDRPSSTP